PRASSSPVVHLGEPCGRLRTTAFWSRRTATSRGADPFVASLGTLRGGLQLAPLLDVRSVEVSVRQLLDRWTNILLELVVASGGRNGGLQLGLAPCVGAVILRWRLASATGLTRGRLVVAATCRLAVVVDRGQAEHRHQLVAATVGDRAADRLRRELAALVVTLLRPLLANGHRGTEHQILARL